MQRSTAQAPEPARWRGFGARCGAELYRSRRPGRERDGDRERQRCRVGVNQGSRSRGIAGRATCGVTKSSAGFKPLPPAFGLLFSSLAAPLTRSVRHSDADSKPRRISEQRHA